MKKLTALVLTLTMLLSMLVIPMGASAAEITEAERKELLKAREYTYLDINPNIDAYASLETIRNYANTNNAVNSTDAYNKVTKVYDEDGTTVLYTYMNRLLNTTHDGKEITGNETYYKKGIANASVDAVRMSPMLYITESFKLSKEELQAMPVKTYTDLSSADTTQNPATIAAARYADPTKFVERITALSSADYNYLPTVVKTETAGDNYYVTIKDPETSAQFKLGPINDSEFVKNALDVAKSTNNYAVVPEGTKGKSLSYAVITADVNSGGSYSGTYALNIGSPTAALSEVMITYNDNSEETRYVLTTNMTKSPIDDMVGLAIYSADKYDSEGNEITYKEELFRKSTSSTNPLTALTGTDLTLDDIIFPSNVDANEINVAIGLRARQDTATNNYGNKAAFGSFELQDKEIKSINFVQDGTPGDEEIEGIIGLYRTTTDVPRALIPVELPEDKADSNKVYFAYVGRFANSVALLGATISSESLQEKIDALNTVLSALDSDDLKEEDIANYRAQIAEIKAESEYILDSDFVTTALDAAEKRIEEEKAAEEAAKQEAARQELLNAPATEYIDIPFTNDGFATAAEVYKYYPRDSSYSIFPSTDVDGNPITNHINGYFANKTLYNKVFTIDSILGNSEGKVTGKYLNDSNAEKTYTYDFKVNGNSKFELQSTETDGTMNFLYNHNGVRFKMGPIGGTGDHLTSTGGYNVHVLPDAVVAYATKGTIENPKSVNILMSTHTVNGGGNAGLFPVEITYADETKETKYVLSTHIVADKPNRAGFVEATGGTSNLEGDGDRLAKTIIYVPKTTDISTGANIAAAEKILSETNAVEITGKAVTLDDVKFPNDDLIIKGEAALIGDFNHARTNAFINSRTYCSLGYVDFLQIPVDKKVTSVHMKRDTEVAKTWKDAIKNSNVAYLPVTIEGASEDYLYFAKLGRLCKNEQEVYAVTIVGQSLKSSIATVNAQLEAAEEKEDIIAALDAMKALIDANEGTVLAKDFNTASAVAKLTEYLNADIEAATNAEEVNTIEAEVDGYVTAYGIDATELKAAISVAKDKFAAERLSQSVYAPIEMGLLNDYFATRTERGGSSDTIWFDTTKPYNKYIGWWQQATVLPMTRTAYSNGAAISVDYTTNGLITKATLKDGRYVLPVGNVPYRLGEINEGILDGNAFDIGAYIAISDDNMLNEKLDEKYALSKGSTSYQVISGTFPVTVANAKKVNVLTTNLMRSSSTTPSLEAVNALVHLDNGETVGYILLTVPGKSSGVYAVDETVVFVPTNTENDYSTYSAIEAAIGGEVKTLREMTDYDVSDVTLPSAPSVSGPSVSSSYLKGLTGEKVGETRTFEYDNLILPESTEVLAADWGWRTDITTSSFEITAPEGRTITAVEFIHDGGSYMLNGYAPAVGAYAKGTGTDTSYLVPATVEGLKDYKAYVRITRNCRHSAVLGMTAETTGTELVANLNTLMANATASDIADIESMKAFIDGETVLYTDLDATARAKYEAIAEAANVAGTIALSDENGAKTVTANINNITGLAGKIYTLIIAFYDKDDNLIKAVPQQYTTSAVKSFSQTLTVTAENVPGNTATVKGFIWKDFKTLIPLGTEAK